MAVVAVTGDIGAGKSTVSRLLAEKFSCPLLDADKIVASLWQDDNVKRIFVTRWGDKILDISGQVIKSEISRQIFSDIDEYKFCNSILHSLVMKELEHKVSILKICVIEIPLLFEACVSRPLWIDKIIYVAAEFETRLHRCKIQRSWDATELMRRELYLLQREKKIVQSDLIIYNDGNIEELKQKITKDWIY